MKITVVGTGYVGLVTGTCFAEMGINVTCVDIDKDKIDNLNRGVIPIFEPGLEELVRKNSKEGRLHFSSSLRDSIFNSPIIFSAVGTPSDNDGSADLSYVLEVAREVGRHAQDYFVIVTKSTVPVGTAEKIRVVIQQELKNRGVELDFDVASNPEFLKEGVAIKDFMSPDRVVIGTDSDRAKQMLEKLYKPFMINSIRTIFMDIVSAEMTKYAANAMLATRISFMNEMAGLCELVGADVDMVRFGIGTDQRIGNKFLYAGAGYGGSCFPKDIRALCNTGREYGYKMSMLEVVDEINERQKYIIVKKLLKAFGDDLTGKTVALWGLSFKPETDDMREAPSLVLIRELLYRGVTIQVFDPVSMSQTRTIIGDEVTYCKNIYETVLDADAMVLMTEWKQFRIPSWSVIKRTMRGDVIVDGRNIYNGNELLQEGFRYYGIGKGE